MLLKTMMALGLSIAKWELHICALFIFLSQPFFSPHSSDPFHSLLRILFCWWYIYNKIVKMWLTFDLYNQMLCNCLAYFSQNSEIQNWCINWWELSSAFHYFPPVLLSVYFCFACQICAHVQFYGKIKTSTSCLLILW